MTIVIMTFSWKPFFSWGRISWILHNFSCCGENKLMFLKNIYPMAELAEAVLLFVQQKRFAAGSLAPSWKLFSQLSFLTWCFKYAHFNLTSIDWCTCSKIITGNRHIFTRELVIDIAHKHTCFTNSHISYNYTLNNTAIVWNIRHSLKTVR